MARRGNGLAIMDATRPNLVCKASALGPRWSKERLCERYGDFVPGPDQVKTYEKRPLERLLDDRLWREYQDALGAARIHRNELREAMLGGDALCTQT